jgi:hypothetical protein
MIPQAANATEKVIMAKKPAPAMVIILPAKSTA